MTTPKKKRQHKSQSINIDKYENAFLCLTCRTKSRAKYKFRCEKCGGRIVKDSR